MNSLKLGLRLVGRLWRGTDRESAELRARHARVFLSMAPWLMGVSVLNVGNIALALREHVAWPPLLAWALLMLLLCVGGLRGWWRWRARPMHSAPAKLVHRATGHAGLYGLMWAVPVMLWFGAVGAPQQMLLAVLVTGTLAAGTFALAALPTAALAFGWTLSLGSAISLLLSDVSVRLAALGLLMAYAGVLTVVAVHLARVMAARYASESQVARQDEVVGLLLRDFEDAAADALWEVDAQGRFVQPSRRLEELFGRGAAQLLPLGLCGALKALQTDGSQDVVQLRQIFERGAAFRDHVVRVLLEQGVRWWALTAKPLRDREGRHEGWRGVIADVTARHQSHLHLSHLAHYDCLTGLANRFSLRNRLAQLVEYTQPPGGRRGALLCLDLDNFKTINDSLGHAVGDAVLQEVATRLRHHMRKADLCCRLGGDEFAVVLDDVRSDAEAQQLAQRLVEALHRPMDVQGFTVSAGASVGLAFLPDHAQSVDEALNAADLALYAAKGDGRGRMQVFTPAMGADRRRRMDLEAGLREALARKELHLVYQPQVNLASLTVVGVEALLRWQHPRLGAVSPAEFMAVADAVGLSHELGAWVIERACADAQQGLLPGRVAINVSVSQARHPDFVDVLRSQIQRHRLHPGRVEIEVTEALLNDHAPSALKRLEALRQLGVRVALDDFGAGYCSVAHLRQFPFDCLKIDRQCIGELTQSDEAQCIVQTLLGLAQGLGMETVAEGVEDGTQMDLLRRIRCESIQGHWVARPMPARELAGWHAQWSAQAQGAGRIEALCA